MIFSCLHTNIYRPLQSVGKQGEPCPGSAAALGSACQDLLGSCTATASPASGMNPSLSSHLHPWPKEAFPGGIPGTTLLLLGMRFLGCHLPGGESMDTSKLLKIVSSMQSSPKLTRHWEHECRGSPCALLCSFVGLLGLKSQPALLLTHRQGSTRRALS